MCSSPSMPSSSWTNAPNSVRRVTAPLTTASGAYRSVTPFHGSELKAFRLRLILRFSALTASTATRTRSPTFKTSLAWWTRCVQLSSLIGIRPSTPGASSTNAPKSISFVTRPSTVSPARYWPSTSDQGSVASCFIPSEMRSLTRSTFRILTSISSPSFSTSDG